MAEIIINIGFPVALIILAMITGTILENRHFASIRERERRFEVLPAVTIRGYDTAMDVAEARIVAGSVVVSLDYFKRFLAGLRTIFGGRMGSYEPLLDRGRREAILRMKESFPDADIIVNLRVETSSVSQSTQQGNKQTLGSIEVLAYGTAIKYAGPATG